MPRPAAIATIARMISVLPPFLHAADEGAIDLDRLERKVLEIAQRGVAHAEVVEPELHAQRAQLAEDFADRLRSSRARHLR